jgi:uncharacterized Zn finger protein
MMRPHRTLIRCLVCGSSEVRTDEVIDHGVVLLAECPRCDHRWTDRPLAQALPALQRVTAQELTPDEVPAAA